MIPASIVATPWSYLAPILLLAGSNLFMTLAWYGHLKFKSVPLVTVIVVSWGIAFVEYCLAVPANRIGSAVYSPAELKTIQEVITLIVFAGFTALYFREPLSLTQGAGFALIALGAVACVSRPAVTVASPRHGPVRLHEKGLASRALDTSEQIADRQDQIGDHRDPESMLGDEGNLREVADHGQSPQNRRNDKDHRRRC